MKTLIDVIENMHGTKLKGISVNPDATSAGLLSSQKLSENDHSKIALEDLSAPELQAISAKIDRKLYVAAKHYSVENRIKFNDLIAIGLRKALGES